MFLIVERVSSQRGHPVVLLAGEGHPGRRRDRGGHHILRGVQPRRRTISNRRQGWARRDLPA